MVILELEGVELDYCQECGSIWLDSGELELLLGEQAGKVLADFEKEERSKEKKLRCPACHQKMEKVVCGNTHLDKCANEHGIWFDEGELAEMIAYGDINSDVLDLLNDMFANKIKEGD
jgi:Zn-finger nucleic acid-binding protein